VRRTAWQRFRRSKLATVAVAYVALITILAAAAPLLSPQSPNAIDLSAHLQPPSVQHPFGTDNLGRDVMSRMIHGSRVSLVVGYSATLLSLIIGSLLGALAGYYGGAADWIVSRLMEVVLCFPFLFLVLGIVALFPPSIYTILIALALTSWTTDARFVRAEFLRIRGLEYAVAARASGAGDSRIIFRHLLLEVRLRSLSSAAGLLRIGRLPMELRRR